MKNIAIFASGSGTNAQKLIEHFSNTEVAKVGLILCNKPDAFVIERARKFSIESFVFGREDFYSSERVLSRLVESNIDFIVLAGFLWLVPQNIIDRFNKRIINIHPALLPLYGGKGMYGDRVHNAVIDNKDRESGISIHYVNGIYDDGDIIFQAKCIVTPGETAESLAEKVHALEYEHFPLIVEKLVNELRRG
jgi:phosphoribosylglycinamide formyltransferase-1